MRSHSARTCDRAIIEVGDVEEEGSLSGKKDSLENIYDDNELLPPPVAPRRKRRTKRASPAIAAAAASSSSIIDYEPEQEEVAISLMMLSRDIGGYSAPTVAESSDKNSVILEDNYLELEDDSYDRLETNNAVGSADLGKQRAMLCKKGIPINGLDRKEAILVSGYQCSTCNKTFTSYHALGGHRASHKRIRTCCMPKNNDGMSENTSEASIEQSPFGLSKKSRIHECVICGKVFSSGQALGGHKRSHLASSGEGGDHQMVAVSKLLDLNLPASVNEGSTNLSPWWVGDGLKHGQPLLSLFSN
ncbi:hypothetical protein HPP92_011949 [Vanilla planifolia]|uniref:C2H2-type domain-containing protein n=1 Tax=Vanilla planifolia TaxID=51239 RepID=A0A835V4W9_VANPL|nr:hypothetical protein HPP92_011949 [Vanilla planifolia]